MHEPFWVELLFQSPCFYFLLMHGLKLYLLNSMTLIKLYKMLIINFLFNWNGLFLVFLQEAVFSITMILVTSKSCKSLFWASNLHVQMPTWMFHTSFKLDMIESEIIFNSLLLPDCSNPDFSISWYGTWAGHSAFLCLSFFIYKRE